MEYFKKYFSNTLAGSGNHFWFETDDENEVKTGRLFYQVFRGGKYNYSLLFSNIIDSTYDNGQVSYKNMVCDEWRIERISVAVCDTVSLNNYEKFYGLTFKGDISKKVMPGEFFSTDPVELCVEKGQYLCIEISFCGKMIPNHEQTIIPTFIWKDGGWAKSVKLPFPAMIGCDAKIGNKLAFWGDSITQGIGTDEDSYAHWNARLADMLGPESGYWNLGLGFGRAEDAASGGAWFYKAKQADAIVLCFGVNDIMQGLTADEIKRSLYRIVSELRRHGLRIVLQTVPPFDYQGGQIKIWEDINTYIKEELYKLCDKVFDVVPVLQKDAENPHIAKYGGHPDEKGCLAWAEALQPVIKEFLSK